MGLNLKVFSANYKLRTTNYKTTVPRLMAEAFTRFPPTTNELRPTMNDHPRASATRAMPWRVRYLRKSIRARATVKAPTKKYKVTA